MRKGLIILRLILLVLISSGLVSGAKPRVIVLSNSIDFELASEFFGFLGNKGMDVVHVSVNEFDTYKEETFIIILGGPDAPDGVGGIVQKLLSSSQQKSIREIGNHEKYVTFDPWNVKKGQRVMILAGSNRKQTQRAHDENRKEVTSGAVEAQEAVASADIVISDTFDANVNGWLMGSRSDDYATIDWSLINGKYRWDVKAYKGVNWYVYSSNIGTLSDFHLTVDAQQISGPENAAYGVVVRLVDTENFYHFAISNTQQYAFSLLYNSEWIQLIDWTTASAIRPGEVNKIEVIAEGSYFRLLINDQFISDVYDDRLTSGNTGVSIDLYTAGDTGVFEFDNFEIKRTIPPITTTPTTSPPPPLRLHQQPLLIQTMLFLT